MFRLNTDIRTRVKFVVLTLGLAVTAGAWVTGSSTRAQLLVSGRRATGAARCL